GGERRADPPGQSSPGGRVTTYRVVDGGGPRAERLPSHPRDGRDPAGELPCVPRRRYRGAVRPLGRRRGGGGRLLPSREPGAEDRALRVADRLRRVPADDRG